MNNHRLSERGPTKSKPRPAIPPTLQRGAARREISTIRGPATLGACSLSGFAAFFFFSHIVEGLGDLRGRELSGLLVKPLQETLLVCGAVSDAGAVVLSIRHVCTSTSTSTSRNKRDMRTRRRLRTRMVQTFQKKDPAASAHIPSCPGFWEPQPRTLSLTTPVTCYSPKPFGRFHPQSCRCLPCMYLPGQPVSALGSSFLLPYARHKDATGPVVIDRQHL